jgi:hypothetical protein
MRRHLDLAESTVYVPIARGVKRCAAYAEPAAASQMLSFRG